jgi:hypothetical protein
MVGAGIYSHEYLSLFDRLNGCFTTSLCADVNVELYGIIHVLYI